MTPVAWNWIESASLLLDPCEREAVLGDLVESGDSFARALGAVIGLAGRRHLELWRDWRPWAASLGLALPASLFLMGNSVAAIQDVTSQNVLQQAREPMDFSALEVSILRLSLLLCWSWMAGFGVGTLSRRTLWASMLAGIMPCLFCLSEWPGDRISSLRLLIFLGPAICGVVWGRSRRYLNFGWAAFLAAAATAIPLMWNSGGGLYGLSLIWPGFFLMATSRRAPA